MPILAVLISHGLLVGVGDVVWWVAVNTGKTANAHGPRTFALLGGIGAIINVLTALLFRFRARQAFVDHFALRPIPTWRPVVAGVVANLGVGYFVVFTLASYGVRSGSLGLSWLVRAAHAPDLASFLLVLLVVSVAAGTTEELLFRGYIQRRLVGKLGCAAGILLTSALFGAWHLDWVQSTVTFFGGIVLGLTAYATGSIRASMIAHIVNNALVVVLTRLSPGDPFGLSLLIASIVVTPIAMLSLIRAARTRAAAERTRRTKLNEVVVPLSAVVETVIASRSAAEGQ